MPTKPDAVAGFGHPASNSPPGDQNRDGTDEPLISIRDLHVNYALRTNAVARLLGRSSGTVRAVDGVNLDLMPGEVVGIVGESGSGKSTLGRALLGLVRPSAGSIRYRGQDLVGLREPQLRPLRRRLQMVFQDPHASLNPSMTIGRAISDALRIHKLHPDDREQAVAAALERVGLAPASRFMPKYPTELSGGQKQRAVIARAIALGPELLVADEPISMLDMSVRAKILGLLDELRRDLGLTYLYITHDLASARFFCDRIAIMYLGKVIEIGTTEEIFENPRHPYTQALLRAVPDPDPSRGVARDLPRGEVPDAADPPAGCPFHPRCSQAFAPCGWESRDLRMILEQRWTAVPSDQFARESKVVGDPELFAAAETSPSEGVVRPASGSGPDLLELLEDQRAADPDDPLWSGVRQMRADGNEVRIEFAERVTPQLLPVSGSSVQVSCHLHHDPTQS
ncbi:MAG TPA: ABC transporter ATP-binding protein [Jatrophihabitantaceae bacterium]